MDPLQQPNQAPVAEKKSFGPLVGVIVIIILLVVGAFYMWSDRADVVGDEAPATQSQAASDDVNAIESDLQAEENLEIDLSELDSI